MNALIRPHHFGGTVRIPASKSHTVRRLIMASLTDGVSQILHPLDSLDTQSCVTVCKAMSAQIIEHIIEPDTAPGGKQIKLTVSGKKPVVSVQPAVLGQAAVKDYAAAPDSAKTQPRSVIHCDVGNSGTTLYLALAAAALGTAAYEFYGDEQIRRRTAGPLLEALVGLGVTVKSAANGCAPISICGPWKGGRVKVPCPTSQYLSALLLAAPLAPAGVVTEIDIPLLNERPYIEMTLSYLKAQNIQFDMNDDFSYFRIPGGASYKPVNGPVPADFSSAAFPACAAMVCAGGQKQITLEGLDPTDCQGDKAFFGMLEKMGCNVKWEKITGRTGAGQTGGAQRGASNTAGSGAVPEWLLRISREGPLKGGVFDLNDTPDLLPVMAVMGAFAQGETALVNVAHARLKETDRIAVMAAELSKLGVNISERPDGLVIKNNSNLINNAGLINTGSVNAGLVKAAGPIKLGGHKDHRIVMALACAALGTQAAAEITGAESAAVTYPGFLESLQAEFI
ncbi:MAG: 3-phosphoshikimate 1-carboxyvinyltransferase [Treponema sp.]|nr:3-phosphoshikimate 1-carboxyvinyltransferase [Treponema sp.]